MTAVAHFYPSHFSAFTVKHGRHPPTATTRGWQPPPAPLFPTAPGGHRVPHLCFPNRAEGTHSPTQAVTPCQVQPEATVGSPFPPSPERGAGEVPGSRYITQPGSQPGPPSDRSGARYGWKVRVHKSQPAQSIKSAHSDNFMGKMDPRQVRGCCQGGWMPAEGRAELWSSRDRLALLAEPPALPPSPIHRAQPVRGSTLTQHPLPAWGTGRSRPRAG